MNLKNMLILILSIVLIVLLYGKYAQAEGLQCDKSITCITIDRSKCLDEVCLEVSEKTTCDYSQAHVNGGYGWNAETKESCPPRIADVESNYCDYSSAHLYSGWGWDSVRKKSCPPNLVELEPEPEPEPVATNTCDYSNASNNNGWGWDPVNRKSCSPILDVGQDAEPEIKDLGDILVLLMGGQSNALNNQTKYDSSLDRGLDNMIVWTSYNGWQKADLCTYIWDNQWYPKAGGNCSNHIGFQIAKNLAMKNPSKTIALIPTGSAGMPISHWYDGRAGLKDFWGKAELALSNLDGKNDVDYIAFAQGESDAGNPKWLGDIYNLIKRTKDKNWFDGKFIVSETFKSDVNEQMQELRWDGNNDTDYVSASGLYTKDGVHWNAAAIRELGKRFAERF